MTQKIADKTKENIYNVALDLFLEKGFEATTVEDIAERSGMSPTDFSKYFPQKESILPSFLRKHIEDVREKIQASMDQETLTSDKLRAIYLALAVIVEENESLIQWVLIESLRLRAYHQEKESVFNAIIDFTVKAIQAGQEKGEVFLSIDPLKIAQILESVFFFTAVSWISFGKKVPLKEDLMTKVESVLQGILTDEAKSVMLSVDEQERRKGRQGGLQRTPGRIRIGKQRLSGIPFISMSGTNRVRTEANELTTCLERLISDGILRRHIFLSQSCQSIQPNL